MSTVLLGPLVLAFLPSTFALAQEEEVQEPTAPADAEPAADAPAPAPEPPGDASTPPEPETPPSETSPDAGEPDSVADPGEPSPADAAAAKETDVETGGAAAAAASEPEPALGTHVTLELVPASGYPSWQVRGIPGGSLGATMHGMQWPYLPAPRATNTLRVGVSGSFWNDLSYARILSGLEESYPNQKRLATQSRGVLRVSPTLSTKRGWFAQGQGEFVIHGDMLIQDSNLASTDDLYFRVGKWKLFDLTAGRFQGWEIANHYGMGLDLNTLERDGAVIQAQAAKPAPAYGLTYFWDRKDGRLGHYAAHVYPTEYLRFELLAELGTGTGGLLRQTNFRPTGIVDLGFLKLKGGVEYGTALPQGDDGKQRIYKTGFGGAVQTVITPWLEAGVHFARGYEDVITLQGVKDVAASNTVTGYGGFLNAAPIDSLVIGVGILDSHWESLSKNATPGEHYGDHNTNDQLQQFVAVQYDLWDQVQFKLVGSHAKFDFYESSSTPFSNEMWGLRFRSAVAF